MSKLEIERKVLDLSRRGIEKRLEIIGAKKLFEGVVQSYYYYGDPKKLFYHKDFKEARIATEDKNEHWIRFRLMKDINGKITEYAETKIKKFVNGQIEKEEIGSIYNREFIKELKINYVKYGIYAKSRVIK